MQEKDEKKHIFGHCLIFMHSTNIDLTAILFSGTQLNAEDIVIRGIIPVFRISQIEGLKKTTALHLIQHETVS